jgi:hypothetical protein
MPTSSWMGLFSAWLVIAAAVSFKMYSVGPGQSRSSRRALVRDFHRELALFNSQSPEAFQDRLVKAWSIVQRMIELAEEKRPNIKASKNKLGWQIKKQEIETDMEDIQFSGRSVSETLAAEIFEKIKLVGLEVEKCL